MSLCSLTLIACTPICVLISGSVCWEVRVGLLPQVHHGRRAVLAGQSCKQGARARQRARHASTAHSEYEAVCVQTVVGMCDCNRSTQGFCIQVPEVQERSPGQKFTGLVEGLERVVASKPAPIRLRNEAARQQPQACTGAFLGCFGSLECVGTLRDDV